MLGVDATISTRCSTGDRARAQDSRAPTWSGRSAGSTPRSGTCAASGRASRWSRCSAGTPGRLRAYASSMKRDITPAAGGGAVASACGTSWVSTPSSSASAAECGHDLDEWPGRTEEIMPAIRRALGADVALLVDANSGFSPARAIEVGRMLRGHWRRALRGALPLLGARADQGGRRRARHRRDRRRAGLRAPDLAADDRDARGRHRAARRPLSRRHQPHAARRRMAEEAGLPVTPHSANLSMVTLFTMHLLGAIRTPANISNSRSRGRTIIPGRRGCSATSPYAVEDGQVTIPTSRAGGSRSSRNGWRGRATG